MKPIKFRGKSMGGHYVYGLLTKKRIRNSGNLVYAIVSGNFSQGETIPVLEDSVAQLVGYDKNDNEIYSDDTVIDLDGNERLVAEILLKFNSIGGHFCNVILKESKDETN